MTNFDVKKMMAEGKTEADIRAEFEKQMREAKKAEEEKSKKAQREAEMKADMQKVVDAINIYNKKWYPGAAAETVEDFKLLVNPALADMFKDLTDAEKKETATKSNITTVEDIFNDFFKKFGI